MRKEEKKILVDSHTSQAEHHAAMGTCCKSCADNHNELADSNEMTNPDDSATHKALANTYTTMAAEHASAAQSHLDTIKALGALPDAADEPTEKTASSDDVTRLLKGIEALLGKTVVPTGARVVPPSDRPAEVSKIVPRNGQPDPNVQKVDANLRHLIHDETQQTA